MGADPPDDSVTLETTKAIGQNMRGLDGDVGYDHGELVASVPDRYVCFSNMGADEGADRDQGTLFPERLDDFIAENNPVRVVEAFVEALDLGALGFAGINPHVTGRPAYHPSALLKLYIYGYLNRIQSSRRLEREAHRNVELIWLTGRLMPAFKTIADFRKDNPKAIRLVCREFVMLCKKLNLLSEKLVAIDGSFKHGVEGAKAGIAFFAAPRVGDFYRQEFALAEAEVAARQEDLTIAATQLR